MCFLIVAAKFLPLPHHKPPSSQGKWLLKFSVIFLRQTAIFLLIFYFHSFPFGKWQIKLDIFLQNSIIFLEKIIETIRKMKNWVEKNVPRVEAILCWSPLGVILCVVCCAVCGVYCSNVILCAAPTSITSRHSTTAWYYLTNKQTKGSPTERKSLFIWALPK